MVFDTREISVRDMSLGNVQAIIKDVTVVNDNILDNVLAIQEGRLVKDVKNVEHLISIED